MNKQQKIQVLEDLKKKLGKAKSFVLADYRGLTHRQLEEIRYALKEVNAEFIVSKNTLFKLSLPSSITQNLSSYLTGPTATLFSYQDEIASLPILAKFIKNFGLPKIKIGVMGEKILTSEEITKIASLPSREILMATLVARLRSPIYGLHYSLNYNLQKLALVLKAASTKQASN